MTAPIWIVGICVLIAFVLGAAYGLSMTEKPSHGGGTIEVICNGKTNLRYFWIARDRDGQAIAIQSGSSATAEDAKIKAATARWIIEGAKFKP